MVRLVFIDGFWSLLAGSGSSRTTQHGDGVSNLFSMPDRTVDLTDWVQADFVRIYSWSTSISPWGMYSRPGASESGSGQLKVSGTGSMRRWNMTTFVPCLLPSSRPPNPSGTPGSPIQTLCLWFLRSRALRRRSTGSVLVCFHLSLLTWDACLS